MLALMIRAVYIGLKRGFISEALNLVALVITIFVVFHYTPVCAQFLENKILFKSSVAKAVTFVSLWALVALAAKFVCGAIFLLFKIEAKSFLDKFGGIVVSLVRGILVCSLVLWLFLVTGSDYITRTVKGAYASPRIVNFAPDVYRGIFNIAVSKYFPNERMKQDFLTNQEHASQQSQTKK
jgi:uncharacterized membrane protein required for colicin V production